jgi:pimeloyl-ACP methyl ester carboxylesterase
LKSILTILKWTAFFALTLAAGATERGTQSQTLKNGSILETEDGFPYKTYEEWLDHGRDDRWKFDEARVRSQFPPEKFQEFKDTLPTKVNSYEEFLALMKRHFEEMQKKMHGEKTEIEAKMRRDCSPELFREFKDHVDCQRISYASEGLKIQGFLLTPRPHPAGRLPVVIYNHGGNPRIGIIDGAKLAGLTWLVRAGYAVVASQYRGCGGSEGSDEIGGADVADVLNLIPLIESLSYADTNRLGMLGWSRGGMMTYLALSQSNRITAAVIGGAPTDLFAELKRRPELESLLQKRVPGYAANRDTALKARSAQFWPEKLCRTTPILLMQGANDQSCTPRSALEMALLLEQSGQPFRLIFFESGSHGLQEHSEEVNQQTLLWFNRYLGKEPEAEKTNER